MKFLDVCKNTHLSTTPWREEGDSGFEVTRARMKLVCVEYHDFIQSGPKVT